MSKIRDLMPWNRPSSIDIRKGEYGLSLYALQEEMNRLFNYFYHGAQVRLTDWDAASEMMPAVNVAETGDSFKVEVALPGTESKNVSVEVAQGFVTISGERKEEKEEKDSKGGNFLRQEISYGSFSRTMALPDAADCDKAKAVFRNGILTVTVPKKAGAVQNPRKIDIKEAA